MTEREFALQVVRKLHQAGFTALWAGGCVRDELLGLVPADYDVATNAIPGQLKPLFPHRNEIGAHFGVVQVIGPRGDDGEWLTVEVATFRIDGPYDPSDRKPTWVEFCSPEEDAKRRDFTINGMFFDPLEGKLIDYVGGRADLEARYLRAIGDPAARFTEDKLRILRAVRMAARFDLAIDTATLSAARAMAAEIAVVSAERIAEELRKLLTHGNRARGVRLLRDFALIEPVLPELVPGFATDPGNPAGSQWDHMVRIVEFLGTDEAAATFPLALAAMLRGLERRSVEAIADRLRLSNAEKTRVAWLVEKRNSLADAGTMRPSVLYPLLVQPGIMELINLHRAEALAAGSSMDHVKYCEQVLRETPPEVLDPPPAVTGDDLIAMGMKPSKEFKRLLETVRAAQLDGLVQSKEAGLRFVQQLRQ
jgi:poly(A) polymerase